MTNEELYQVVKDGFDLIRTDFADFKSDVNQRLDKMDQRLDKMDQHLDGMDARLRTVENGISGLTGKQQAISGMRNWITTACAIGAIIISIIVAIFK